MLLVGDNSPHDEDVMEMNGRMDPEKTDFMKVILIRNKLQVQTEHQ